MTGWVWAGIFIGLALVVFAVGTPYLITHKGLRSPYHRANRDEAKAYFRVKRRWQRQGGTGSAEPGTMHSEQAASGSSSRRRH